MGVNMLTVHESRPLFAVNSTYNKPSNLTNASSPTGGDTFVVARALYNHEAYHTAAVALNVIDNVLLRHLVGGDNYTIETMNHPIDGADDMLTKVPVMKETFTGLLVSVVLLFGMSFYTSTFVLFLIQERKVGCLRCESTCSLTRMSVVLNMFKHNIYIYLKWAR